jgi:hypothetical protein
MWGNTQVATVVPTLININQIPENANTMVRATYGRPETWRFLFHTVIESGGTDSAIGETALLEINYDLIVGIGRSAVKIVNFATLLYDWSGGLSVFRGQPLFVTQTRGFNQIGGTPDPAPLIDQFVAQDITIVANAAYLTDVPGAVPVKVAVSAQIAPNHHQRPDWFLMDKDLPEQFPGAEIGGR